MYILSYNTHMPDKFSNYGTNVEISLAGFTSPRFFCQHLFLPGSSRAILYISNVHDFLQYQTVKIFRADSWNMTASSSLCLNIFVENPKYGQYIIVQL